MDAALQERLKAQMAWEFARTGPPAGFPKFPDIPIGRYTSDEFYELEQRHLWSKVWVMAGRAEDVAEPGDYMTFDDLGLPILLVRGEDRVLRAFYNTCQHRGAPVVRDQRGHARNLRCQYHSWTYDITHGQLIQVPDERDFVGLCRDERGLVQISCEVWQGWIFVNRDPDAPTLHEWFEPALSQLDELSGDTLSTVAVRSVIVPCNWKVTAEAFLEVYHFRHIHARGPAGGDTALDNRGAAMGLLPNGCSRMITPFSPAACKARGMSDWSDWQHFTTPPFLDIDSISDVVRCTSSAYSLFPNLITPLGSYGFPFLLFWPIDKRTTKLDWIHYGPKDWEGDELPPHWQVRMDGFDMIMDEDMRNMAPMQRSLESPAMRGVPTNYQERRIWHLHEQIDRTIGIDRIPEHLRVPQLLADYVEREPASSNA
jgi:phenylpropionate dioxygenase-like ring-hydroxylating dioxygenase large terminal subunit